MREDLISLSKEELLNYIEDLSKNWLAIDGTWFQAVEQEYGLKKAIELDVKQWERFTVIEAKRIMQRFKIPENGGIPALIEALKYRVYANINKLTKWINLLLTNPITYTLSFRKSLVWG